MLLACHHHQHSVVYLVSLLSMIQTVSVIIVAYTLSHYPIFTCFLLVEVIVSLVKVRLVGVDAEVDAITAIFVA